MLCFIHLTLLGLMGMCEGHGKKREELLLARVSGKQIVVACIDGRLGGGGNGQSLGMKGALGQSPSWSPISLSLMGTPVEGFFSLCVLWVGLVRVPVFFLTPGENLLIRPGLYLVNAALLLKG